MPRFFNLAEHFGWPVITQSPYYLPWRKHPGWSATTEILDYLPCPELLHSCFLYWYAFDISSLLVSFPCKSTHNTTHKFTRIGAARETNLCDADPCSPMWPMLTYAAHATAGTYIATYLPSLDSSSVTGATAQVGCRGPSFLGAEAAGWKPKFYSHGAVDPQRLPL